MLRIFYPKLIAVAGPFICIKSFFSGQIGPPKRPPGRGCTTRQFACLGIHRSTSVRWRLAKHAHFISLVVLLGCGTPASYPVEFEPFIETFISEAAKRGRDMAYMRGKLRIIYEDLPATNGGKCTRSLLFPDRISIDKVVWQQMNERQREAVLFHEFGHCFIGRDHRNEKLSQGECASLMDGRENGFFCSNNYYSENWREYYLDELFDENTPIPEWYIVYEPKNLPVVDTLIDVADSLLYKSADQEWYAIYKELEWDSLKNYLFEITFNQDLGDSSWLHVQFGEYIIAVLEKNRQTSIKATSRTELMQDDYYREYRSYAPDFPLKFSLMVKEGWLVFFINGEQKHLFETKHYRPDPIWTRRQGGRIISGAFKKPNARLRICTLD